MPEDLAAIDRYMKGTLTKTGAAVKIRDEWTEWYDGIGWWGSYSQENYDHARNLRNQFNLANATTAAERDQAQYVIETGMTTEEMAGGTRRNLSTGMYAEPLVSSETKFVLIAGAVAASVTGGILLLGKLEMMGPKLLARLLR